MLSRINPNFSVGATILKIIHAMIQILLNLKPLTVRLFSCVCVKGVAKVAKKAFRCGCTLKSSFRSSQFNMCVSTEYRVHRVKIATGVHPFHLDGKISPELWCTLLLSGLMHSSLFLLYPSICTLCLGHTDEDSFGHSLRGSPLPHVQDERIVVSYSGNRRPGPFVTSESQLTHRNAVSHAEKVSTIPLVS
jgi:hypothetical protein